MLRRVVVKEVHPPPPPGKPVASFEDWWWSLEQLPQFALLAGYERLPPYHGLGLRVCDRGGLCIEAGDGGLPALTPLERRWVVLWHPRLEARVEPGSLKLFPRSIELRESSLRLKVYNPRVWALEPLSARVVVAREGVVLEPRAGCVETVGEGYAFVCRRLCKLVYEDGVLTIEGDVLWFRVPRCGSRVFTPLLNSLVSVENSMLQVRGSVVLLQCVAERDHARLLLWPPARAGAVIEVRVEARILDAHVCDAAGCRSIEPHHDQVTVMVGGRRLVLLELGLKPLPKLLRRRGRGGL